jgi:hypothetical protein
VNPTIKNKFEANSMNTVSSGAVRSSGVPVASAHPGVTDAFPGNVRTIWMALKLTFSLVPVVAGVVGVIEIVAGIIVFARPRVGALIVAAWLGCIALSLLVSGHYLDVAVRDLVMAVAAFALAGLTVNMESPSQRGQ